jgi:hypothetical protein
MPCFLIHHHHEPQQCGIAYANFKGFASPLRRRPAFASCLDGDHDIWWMVEAVDDEAARRQLPYFVAQRSTVTRVAEVQIP